MDVQFVRRDFLLKSEELLAMLKKVQSNFLLEEERAQREPQKEVLELLTKSNEILHQFHATVESQLWNHFDRLPNEVVSHIFEYIVSIKQIGRLCLVSKRFKEIVSEENEALWQSVSLRWWKEKRLYAFFNLNEVLNDCILVGGSWKWFAKCLSQQAQQFKALRNMPAWKLTDGGSLLEIGDFSNGKLNGRGICVWISGKYFKHRYVGDVKDGKRNGKGIHVWPNGSRYVGEFQEVSHLSLKLYYMQLMDCVKGKEQGRGVLTLSNGTKYEGEFKEGAYHGRGIHTQPSGEKYVGEFKYGKRDGLGICTWPIGEQYKGEFRDGMFFGKATHILPNGETYIGEFKFGKRDGKGVCTWADGSKYEGEYKEGVCHGRGIVTWSNGIQYEGEFVQGMSKSEQRKSRDRTIMESFLESLEKYKMI